MKRPSGGQTFLVKSRFLLAGKLFAYVAVCRIRLVNRRQTSSNSYFTGTAAEWSTSFYRRWNCIDVRVAIRCLPPNPQGKFAPKTPYLLVSRFARGRVITPNAGVAQLVEQLICNHQVVSSSLITGSIFYKGSSVFAEAHYL